MRIRCFAHHGCWKELHSARSEFDDIAGVPKSSHLSNKLWAMHQEMKDILELDTYFCSLFINEQNYHTTVPIDVRMRLI
ncbi:hypothetical protein Y032_0100g3291 [Ancylostoma ceylanicum]|uniref:Uncharacterized protein n=1 Tax=Ancylostoma ceylanicum TaxID=53326 RepID=A0A016TIL0_9BILA|nr:hypothetical protein Y032_0100g3291 [Ancylostoma ceylanicum]